MSDPQPGPDEHSTPGDPVLPTDFWEAPLPPHVVASGGDGTPVPDPADRVAWSDPAPTDLAGSWFWADETPEAAEVPVPDDAGDVVMGPAWWEVGPELQSPLPDVLVQTPASVEEPEPLPSAVRPGDQEPSAPGPEQLGADLFFVPAWPDTGDELESPLPDDLIQAPAPVDDPEPAPRPEAGDDLFFAPTWAQDGDDPEAEVAKDLVLEPGPVAEPEPSTLAFLPGPPSPAVPDPGRWDRLRAHRPGPRATAAAVVGLVLGASVLVGALSQSGRTPTDMVQSGATTVQPARPRSVPSSQPPVLQALPDEAPAPATDAPATEGATETVEAGAGLNPAPAAGAPARASGVPAPPAGGGPRPASGRSLGPAPAPAPARSPAPAPAPAPAAASARPAPAAAASPYQDQPEPTVSRRTSRTSVPPTTAAPPQPPATPVPPAEEVGQLPCFQEIRSGRLACPK
jgi:hypothetical protein